MSRRPARWLPRCVRCVPPHPVCRARSRWIHWSSSTRCWPRSRSWCCWTTFRSGRPRQRCSAGMPAPPASSWSHLADCPCTLRRPTPPPGWTTWPWVRSPIRCTYWTSVWTCSVSCCLKAHVGCERNGRYVGPHQPRRLGGCDLAGVGPKDADGAGNVLFHRLPGCYGVPVPKGVEDAVVVAVPVGHRAGQRVDDTGGIDEEVGHVPHPAACLGHDARVRHGVDSGVEFPVVEPVQMRPLTKVGGVDQVIGRLANPSQLGELGVGATLCRDRRDCSLEPAEHQEEVLGLL